MSAIIYLSFAIVAVSTAFSWALDFVWNKGYQAGLDKGYRIGIGGYAKPEADDGGRE